MKMSNSKTLLEKRIIETQIKFLNKGVDEKGYLKSDDPQDNLIEPFSNWEQIANELNEGACDELKSHGGKPNFLAVHSSSALCVNTFAPFKEHCKKLDGVLTYPDMEEPPGFDKAKFGKQLPTGLDETPPPLDFYLGNKTVTMGIVSKFTEYFDKKAPNHPTESEQNNLEPYRDRKKLYYLPKEFQENIIEHYFHDDSPQHLDVAQLIKHAIGLLKHRRHKIPRKKAVLVYMYWEPLHCKVLTNTPFAEHHRNIGEFERRMSQFERFIDFVHVSYPDFWRIYAKDDLLEEHIRNVRDRYEFEIEL